MGCNFNGRNTNGLFSRHNGGLIVILSIRLVVIGPDENWAYLHHALNVPEGTPGIARCGCSRRFRGETFERLIPMATATIEARISSVPTRTTAGPMNASSPVIDDYYDSPLESGKQRPDVKSLDELNGEGNTEESLP
jgi:hypothetical protein